MLAARTLKGLLALLRPLGRALMLPIAVLPVAGLLLRLGQPDLLDIPFVAAAGSAIFGHLGPLFAIGVGVGLARENHGAAGLAGAVAYFVAVEGAKTLLTVPPEIGAGLSDAGVRDTVIAAWRDAQLNRLSVPAGILSGLSAGWLYNRYANIKLPDFLAFFGGRRFVPIAAGFVGIALALVFGLGFPLLSSAIDTLSRWVVGAGPLGLFLYGVLNRLLIVTGLHHILNNLAWFIIGDFHGATGDLKRFFAGDPSAGAFMSGLRLVNPGHVDESALKALGSRGLFRPGADAVQVVLGPIADQVASEMRQAAKRGAIDIEGLARALASLRPLSLGVRDTRLLLRVAEPVAPATRNALEQAGVRAVIASRKNIQIIAGPGASALADRLSRSLNLPKKH